MSKVIVTGYGVISALGVGVINNHNALRKSSSGIEKAQFLHSKYANHKPFAEVKLSNKELHELANLPKNKVFSRTDMLAIIATKEALENAGLSESEISNSQTAFISASTVGGMCHTDELHSDSTRVSESPTPFLGHYSTQAHSKTIALTFGIKGQVSTFNTACSSSANAISFGARLIKSGRAKRVIVGGTDSLGKFTVNGFNSLGILSNNPCKPFDKNRDGLTLGEGAAYLVLESEDCAKNKTKLAEVLGYGNSNDAFHASAISPDATGPKNAMQSALIMAGIKPDSVCLINTHGTGTSNNDFSELKAIETVFKKFPPFISTKAFTGHTLGAAGAIEAIYSILSLLNNEIYPSLNSTEPVEGFECLPVSQLTTNIEINHVMSNSFGFAGNCSSLVFCKA